LVAGLEGLRKLDERGVELDATGGVELDVDVEADVVGNVGR